MAEFKKILSVIVINIFILCAILFFADYIVYRYNANNFDDTNWETPQYKYSFKPNYNLDITNYFSGKDNKTTGRIPDGLEYNNKNPIVVFGCSYAYGLYLNYNQTLSYKLAHILKRPVYNRAIPGRSFQQMYLQTLSDSFYNDIPSADDVIYVVMHDHYRRMFAHKINTIDPFMLEHFKTVNGKLVADNENNIIKNIIFSSYLYNQINNSYLQKYINNSKNADKITDETIKYFVESRNNMEKKWNKKINFYVLIYEPVEYSNLLQKKLKNNNFKVVSTYDLTHENLYSDYYWSNTLIHPKENSWNLLTPKIIKYFGL